MVSVDVKRHVYLLNYYSVSFLASQLEPPPHPIPQRQLHPGLHCLPPTLSLQGTTLVENLQGSDQRGPATDNQIRQYHQAKRLRTILERRRRTRREEEADSLPSGVVDNATMCPASWHCVWYVLYVAAAVQQTYTLCAGRLVFGTAARPRVQNHQGKRGRAC